MSDDLTQELVDEFKTYNQHQINDAFIIACQYGHLNIVKYLLTTKDLIKSFNNNESNKATLPHGVIEFAKPHSVCSKRQRRLVLSINHFMRIFMHKMIQDLTGHAIRDI